MIEELFRQFVKERRYVQNSSPHTIAFYEQSFKTYHRVLDNHGLPTKQTPNRVCDRNS